MPFKFGIDKRKITYSAQILSGAISREEALKILEKNPITEEEYKQLISFVIKKLDMPEDEFKTIFKSSNKSYMDYPSYYPFFQTFLKVFRTFLKLLFIYKPMFLFQYDMRKKGEIE